MPNAQALANALKPLAAIATAHDRNELDHGYHADTPAKDIEIFAGRGGSQLLTLADAVLARHAISTMRDLEAAAQPLINISRAYDANELDDEARKRWGRNLEHANSTPLHEIELVTTGGGACLLSLGHARDAHMTYLELKEAALAS